MPDPAQAQTSAPSPSPVHDIGKPKPPTDDMTRLNASEVVALHLLWRDEFAQTTAGQLRELCQRIAEDVKASLD